MVDQCRTQYVENRTYTRGQDKYYNNPKIGGRVERLVATVAHVNSLMDMSNQWSFLACACFRKLKPSDVVES